MAEEVAVNLAEVETDLAVDTTDGETVATDAICLQLLKDGRLREPDLKRASVYRDQHGGDLVSLLVRLGLASERDVAEAASSLLSLPLILQADYPAEAPQVEGMSMRYLKQNLLLPIERNENQLKVVMTDPRDEFAIKALAMASGLEISPCVGIASEIENGIEKLFGGGRSQMGQIVDRLGEGEEDLEDVEHLRDLASEAPVIRLVNLVLQRAVEARASDIHIEPFENRLKVRYRIDGVLQEVESPPSRSTAAVISRIKIMANLNIAERRLPQDGRIMHRVQGKELDLRVSTVPTSHGESVVMRILDRESIVLSFDSLGFDEKLTDQFVKVLELPHGIILVTGPTGSGKTTTLYTALSQINTPERKIITVEDPVEYQLEGINQIQAKASIGLDFAHALRAIVRQDPDVIMIGEMRDLETAKIAIQSALTGHLVLSTLHTNDAASGITRMLDMGVDDYLLTSTINGILAQRLVRTLDPEHREPYELLPEMTMELGFPELIRQDSYTVFKPVPTEDRPTGYRGRAAIVEMIRMTDPLRRMVMNHATSGDLQEQAVAEGMRTMYQDGLLKCLKGVTTVDEVLRVTPGFLMALFEYKAVAPTGETVQGTMEGSSVEGVIAKLQEAGNIPLQARQAGQGLLNLSALRAGRRGMNTREVGEFTQQLSTLLGAGLPLDRSLGVLVELAGSQRVERSVGDIRERVRGGGNLSDALEAQHGAFSRLYVNMVRAGEIGGSLDRTLARLSEYLERSRDLKDAVISALIYPIMLILLAVGSLLLLLMFVIPQFMPIFEELGQDLPTITKVVLAVGAVLQNYWWALLGLSVLAVVMFRRMLDDADKKLRWDTWALNLRWIGDLIGKLEVARLSRTLGTMLVNGVPLLAALRISSKVVGNSLMRNDLDNAARDVKTGGGLTRSLANSGNFPRLALQMVSVGEETGQLDDMLLKVADSYDREVRNTIDRLLSIFTPVVTLLMAIMIGTIVLSVLLAIISVNDLVG